MCWVRPFNPFDYEQTIPPEHPQPLRPPPMAAPQGWVCPKCGAVLAPVVMQCPNHTTTTGTITIDWGNTSGLSYTGGDS